MNNWFLEVGVKRLRRPLLWAPGPWWEMLLAYGFGGEFHTPLGAVSLWFCSLALSPSLSFSVSLSLQSFWSSSRAEKPQPKSLITNLPWGGKENILCCPHTHTHTHTHTHSLVIIQLGGVCLRYLKKSSEKKKGEVFMYSQVEMSETVV